MLTNFVKSIFFQDFLGGHHVDLIMLTAWKTRTWKTGRGAPFQITSLRRALSLRVKFRRGAPLPLVAPLIVIILVVVIIILIIIIITIIIMIIIIIIKQ